ncbi:MAG: hypothetical protein OEY22_11575 [Candidatus Bathyarchaeota archaeon]|nr:hypothetical protein [Candidatus Bathyarchaeota archaeon]MDH5787827.1 hypothetical protein [Candidatus Bathyarchaeota archaeon]
MESSRIVKQDMKAALSAAQNDDFEEMNIYSNRIMTNAIFDENSNFALLGFFFKEIARTCGSVKTNRDTTAYATAKSIATSYIESVDIESKSEQLWSNYVEFYNKIRKYEQNEHENKSYEDDLSFTNASLNWLVELINKDRKLLFKPENRLITGILTEMERIARVHGAQIREICLISLFRALNLYSSYLDYFDKDYRNEIIENSVLPYLDSIKAAAQNEKIDFDPITQLLAKIIFDWRVCYIRFMERPRIVPIGERKVAVSEETKKRLSESVEKALQKEVK